MRYTKVILISVVICIVVAFAFRGALLHRAYDFLAVPGGGTSRADAIVVFCGGGGERMDYGVKLYREGMAGKLLFCGTDDEARFARSVLRGVGVAEGGAVQVRGGLRGTYDSMKYARAWARENGVDSFLAVSSPLHMRRLRLLAGRLLGTGPPRPVFCPVPETRAEGEWWRVDSTRRAVVLEWKKLLWTFFRYWD